MAGKWPVLSLREAGVELLDCDHRTPPPSKTGYPYVAIPQIKEGRLDLTEVRLISRDHLIEWTRKTCPQQWDVILSRRCNPGETAVVPPGIQCALGQNLVILRADGWKVAPEFLRWLVRGPDWWEQVQSFINVGAVFDSLKCQEIPSFRLPVPPLEVQRAVAHILGTLDDKIELNRRMNETLEGMARALFKSWFVDFDPVRAKAEGRDPGLPRAIADLFPDRFEESVLGNIPAGWMTTTLKNLTTKIGSGATPFGGSAVYVNEGVALIRSQNIYDHEFRWGGLARLTDRSAAELQGVEVKPEDILLNITGDSILRTCVVDPHVLPARVNQHVAIIRAALGVPPCYLHLFLVQPRMKNLLAGLDAGATRKAVTKGQLESVNVLQPAREVLARFAEATTPLLQRVDWSRSESRTIAALRDTLLPKLISGELRVKDAERIAEGCA